MTEDFVAAANFLKGRGDCSGKFGAVGFCYGGGMVHTLTTRLPELNAAVPFYGNQPPAEDAAKVKAPLLYDNARQFPDEAAAKSYAESVKGSRVQMVIKISDRKRSTIGGKEGLLVDVLAWRVFVPCTGAVLIASPASGAVEPDRKACARPAK